MARTTKIEISEAKIRQAIWMLKVKKQKSKCVKIWASLITQNVLIQLTIFTKK